MKRTCCPSGLAAKTPSGTTAWACGYRRAEPASPQKARRSRGCPRTKALDLQETAGLRVCDAKVVGPLALPARELVGEGPEDRRGQVGIEGDHTGELTRESEDPLAVTCVWQNAGDTFLANAILEAMHAFRATGAVCLADDSGLEVDALGGAPGVQSARYAGPDARDVDDNRKLLLALADVPPERRTARFRAVVVLVIPIALAARVGAVAPEAVAIADGEALLVTASGAIEGVIVDDGKGGGGFGYDPYFYYPPAQRTFAELTPEAKHAVSHRGQALAALRPVLQALFADIGAP